MQTAFNKRIAIVILIVVTGIIKTFSQQAVNNTPSLAPLSEEFLLYMQNKSSDNINYGYAPPPNTVHFDNAYFQNKSANTFPSSYDLSTAGPNGSSLITSVKDQGSCGSCWTFASMAAIESQWIKQGLGSYDLSENNLKNCHGFVSGPCDGGNIYKSTAYLSRMSGPAYEINDPYSQSPNTCISSISPVNYITDMRLLPNNINEIKQALMDYGAVQTAFYWVDSCYNSSNYTYYFNGTNSINHIVTIAGWDDNKITAGGTGAWLIKNSWGSTWGNNGYFYISYNDSKINTSSLGYFPIKKNYNPNSTLYSIDKLGYTNSWGYNNTVAYALIKYIATSNYPLKSIGTYAVASNTNITIEVYNTFTNGTLSNLLATIPVQNCIYPGYYTFNLSNQIPITTGDDFYIKIKYETPAYNYPIPVETNITNYSVPQIESGVCWISSNGNNGNWYAIGNNTTSQIDLCIKVYAENSSNPVLNVSPTTQNVTSTAGSTQYAVSSNVAWTATSNQTWCTVTPSGNGSGVLTANFIANTVASPRTATITLSATGVAPLTLTLIQDGYFAVLWSSTMSNNTEWIVSNASNATVSTQWVRLADTSLASSSWKYYVGNYMGSATPLNGVYYFDGVTNLVNGIYGIENSKLCKATPISTSGHPNVKIKFYQLYKSYNADSSLLEISSDNVNWYSIDVNPTIAANQYAYGWKEYNISQWAGNKSQVWIRFRFYGPSAFGSPSQGQYGGGYGWMIDDVSVLESVDNELSFDYMSFYEGYTQIPIEQNIPIKLEAKITNTGGQTQSNVKLKAKELNTNTIYDNSIPKTILSSFSDTLVLNNINLPDTVGEYLISSFISSNNINQLMYSYTYKVYLNNNHFLSRDYNNYYTNRWVSGNQYLLASKYKVKQTTFASSINFVVGNPTKVNSKVKVVLYKGNGQNKTLVAESNNYYITTSNIPTLTGINPPSITLPLISPVILYPDTEYWAGVRVLSGNDSVKIAVDYSTPLQNNNTIAYMDLNTNQWNYWSNNQIYPTMIRLSLKDSSFINISPVTQNVSSTSGIAQFAVTSNVSWTASSNQSWCTVTPSGNGNGSITTNLTANTTSFSRTATITVSASGITPKTLTVIQSGIAIPSQAGIINGPNNVCQGQNNVVYTVPPISNATSYIWTLPNGINGTSTTNSITLSFGNNAISDSIKVKGHNSIGDGLYSALKITVNPLPASAGTISGLASVCQGQSSVVYKVPTIANATSYTWTLPNGTTVTNSIDSIIVNFGTSATSGILKVKGNNTCGNGDYSTLAITVNPLPQTPVITQNGDSLLSDVIIGNQWYSLINGIINNATSAFYLPQQIGDYFTIVTLNGCSSDTSNILHFDNTGINNLFGSDCKILVSPNPATSTLNLNLSQQGIQNATVSFYDIQGKQLLQQNITEAQTQIDISSFSKGIYIVKLQTDKETLQSKFVKE